MLKKSFFALTLLSLLAVGSQQLFADSIWRVCNTIYHMDLAVCSQLPEAEQPACIAQAEEMRDICITEPYPGF